MPRPVILHTKMALINKPLIPIKVLLFFVWGGYGCLWPFLSVHMKQLGLTVEETAIINLVTPFTSLLGPPLISVFTTKTQRHKLILSICLLISAFAFTALLFVPPTIRHEPRDPSIIFECDSQGGRVHVEQCENSCSIPSRSPLPSTLMLRHCSYICDEDLVGPNGGLEETVPSKPYICTDGPNETVCQIYNMSGYAFDIKLSVPYMEYIESPDSCIYPLINVVNGSVEKPMVHCRIQKPGCAVHCIGLANILPLAKQEDVSEDVELVNLENQEEDRLQLHQCQKIDGHPLLTFASYMVLRIVAEFFMYSCLALMESSVINNMWEFGGTFSQQFIWGILPIGLLCPLLGLIVDSFAGVLPRMDYLPVFALFDVMVVISVLLLTFLPVRVYACVNKLGSFIGRISSSGEVVTCFFMMFFLGTVFGFLETFYYWFLYEKGANHLFLGLTLTVGVFPAIPILVFGDGIVHKCGHANFIIAAFFAYSLRLCGYAVIDDFRYFFPFEVLKVLSHFLMWVAAVTYCERLGPKLLSMTITGTVGFMHNNIGRGVGALMGGYIMNFYGAVNAFRVMAVYSGFIGLIYMSIYHFYLKDRKAPIYIDASKNGHYTPMETYSNGDKSKKPMLASKSRY